MCGVLSNCKCLIIKTALAKVALDAHLEHWN